MGLVTRRAARPLAIALALVASTVFAKAAPKPRPVATVVKQALHDREVTVKEARKIVQAAHAGGVTLAERKQVQKLVDTYGDRIDPAARALVATVAPKNSTATVRRALLHGKVDANQARDLVAKVKKDGVTPAERRELVRLSSMASDQGRLTTGARAVLDRLRTTRDAATPDPFNQPLPIRPGDDGNRIVNPDTDTDDFEIARGSHLFDGEGHDRGVVLGTKARVNFGQRKSIGGAPFIYVFAVVIREPSGKELGASGWIAESAFARPLSFMPTVAAPAPPRGDSHRRYEVTGGTKGLNDRLESEHVKVLPRIPAHRRCAATDYLRREGDVVNLLYNLPGKGGVSTDTVAIGSTFVRASGVAVEQIDLYAPDSTRVIGKMSFVYGRVGERYGWIALDALKAR